MAVEKPDLEKLHAKIVARKKAAEDALRQEAPALWWALNVHVNSRGETMTFDRVPYLRALYAGIRYNPRMVVEKSVQCGLSELFIVNSHIEAASGLSVMYVLPKYELRNRFVNNRIYKLHRRVPRYAEMLRRGGTGTGLGIHRTSLMHFGKGTLAYVGSNVESEFIEMPVDSAYVDEKDRCNLTNLLLLPDRYVASPYKYHREISNPTVEGFGIDQRYLESSMGRWMIRCDHCGKWFSPDFFLNVVKQTGPRLFVPRDTDYDPENELSDIELVCECGKKVDRCKDGEWVHAYEKKEWQGYRISKVFNKFARLRELYKKFLDAQGNDTKLQVFYNSDLGLPFSSKGAKVTTTDLNRCKRDYVARPEEATGNPRIIGVDVGADIHYEVRDVVVERGIKCRRLLDAGSVPSFELLGSEVIDKWNPRIVVIDAEPEIHKVQDLKRKYKMVYSSHFSEGKRDIHVDKKDREITMDRTAILDAVKAAIDQEILLLPKNAEFLDNGQYYTQMTASTRILEVDEEKNTSRFVWVHTMPDHHFLAEGYCTQAFMLLPNVDEVIGFFKANIAKEAISPEINKIEGITEEKKKELERLSRMTPEMILHRIREDAVKKK